MRTKRGQAAMEFLMTYGWAILAAIIVVGVLWYIIGDPSNLAGDSFQVSAPLSANAMSLDTSELQLELRNGAGSSINITDVELDGDAGCTDLSGQQIQIGQGDLMVINVTCSLTEGDRYNADVVFKYTESGSSVTQKASGSVSATVSS